MATVKGPLEPIVIGADLGNATISIADKDRAIAFFPSFVADLTVPPYQGMSKIATSHHHIGYGDVNAVVGSDAIELPGHETLMADAYGEQDAHKRYIEAGSLYCLLAGISAAYPTADLLGVHLATGAPLSIYEQHGAAIKAHYLGRHEYTYNGHSRAIVVQDVTIYGEGREALRLLPEKDRAGRIAVHDLGGRTWNTLLFRNGALVGFRTFDMGVDRLLNGLRGIVSTDPGARWHMQQEMRKNTKALPAVRAALLTNINRAIGAIERKVAINAADHHVLMGGGAVYLSSVIKARYGKAAIVLNEQAPEAANAIAYARAASEVL